MYGKGGDGVEDEEGGHKTMMSHGTFPNGELLVDSYRHNNICIILGRGDRCPLVWVPTM